MKTQLCIWLGLLLWIKFSGVIIASEKEIEMVDMAGRSRLSRGMQPIGDSFTVTLHPMEYTLGLSISKIEEIEKFCHIHYISLERRSLMKEWRNPIQVNDEIVAINGVSVGWNSQRSVIQLVENELTKKGFVTMTLQHMEDIDE